MHCIAYIASAAIDTIDQDVLIDRLQNYTGIQGAGFKMV